jgi:hypothetical protein
MTLWCYATLMDSARRTSHGRLSPAAPVCYTFNQKGREEGAGPPHGRPPLACIHALSTAASLAPAVGVTAIGETQKAREQVTVRPRGVVAGSALSHLSWSSSP